MASRRTPTNGTTMIPDAECKHSINFIDYGECKHGTYVNVVVLGFHRGDHPPVRDNRGTRRGRDSLQAAPGGLEAVPLRVPGYGPDRWSPINVNGQAQGATSCRRR